MHIPNAFIVYQQKKQTKDDKDFSSIVEFHQDRYDRLTHGHNHVISTPRSDETGYSRRERPDWHSSTARDAASISTVRNNSDWRTRISQRVRDEYAELLRRNENSQRQQMYRRQRAYFRDAEQSLAVGIDLRRYHHAI